MASTLSESDSFRGTAPAAVQVGSTGAMPHTLNTPVGEFVFVVEMFVPYAHSALLLFKPNYFQAAFYGGASNQQTYYQNDAYDVVESGGDEAFGEGDLNSSSDYQQGE